MSETPQRKFGPTKGEYLFRLGMGVFILALIGVAIVTNGLPEGIMSSESILFGSVFAVFLVAQASWKLFRGDYRRL